MIPILSMPTMPMLPSNVTVFTVSHLNQQVRALLENTLGQIWLMGEISNFSCPASGHWYFSLKDHHAQVRCAMFRQQQKNTKMAPNNGQQIIVRAHLTLYEPRGEYQLIIESMQPAGDGILQQQFEQLKAKLHAEGLFDALHKRPLPIPAKCVGVITSASGAALQDILQILSRRDPALPVIVYPSLVQGNDAPKGIIKAITLANRRAECDVLIVGRGGGSLEDLSCFNDEGVARAIFASQIPIISAVGHEVDVTIADLVADLRAPTPSAAAELVSRNQVELVRQLQTQQRHLSMAIDYFLIHKQQSFNTLFHQLQQRHPQIRLVQQRNAFFILHRKLIEALQYRLQKLTQQYQICTQSLLKNAPNNHIHQLRGVLQSHYYQLSRAMEHQLHQVQQRLAIACSQLETTSPLGILARGYGVISSSNGVVIKKIQQVKKGERVHIHLLDGNIEAQVAKIIPSPMSEQEEGL